MALQLTGRFNLLSLTADKACLKNNGVEQVRSGYNWHNIEVMPIMYHSWYRERAKARKP